MPTHAPSTVRLQEAPTSPPINAKPLSFRRGLGQAAPHSHPLPVAEERPGKSGEMGTRNSIRSQLSQCHREGVGPTCCSVTPETASAHSALPTGPIKTGIQAVTPSALFLLLLPQPAPWELANLFTSKPVHSLPPTHAGPELP